MNYRNKNQNTLLNVYQSLRHCYNKMKKSQLIDEQNDDDDEIYISEIIGNDDSFIRQIIKGNYNSYSPQIQEQIVTNIIILQGHYSHSIIKFAIGIPQSKFYKIPKITKNIMQKGVSLLNELIVPSVSPIDCQKLLDGFMKKKILNQTASNLIRSMLYLLKRAKENKPVQKWMIKLAIKCFKVNIGQMNGQKQTGIKYKQIWSDTLIKVLITLYMKCQSIYKFDNIRQIFVDSFPNLKKKCTKGQLRQVYFQTILDGIKCLKKKFSEKGKTLPFIIQCVSNRSNKKDEEVLAALFFQKNIQKDMVGQLMNMKFMHENQILGEELMTIIYNKLQIFCQMFKNDYTKGNKNQLQINQEISSKKQPNENQSQMISQKSLQFQKNDLF